MTDDKTPGFHALAREIVATTEEPDPHQLIDAYLGKLSRRERAALIQYAAGDVLREAIRYLRMAGATQRGAGMSWKLRIAEDELGGQPYCVDGTWKMLADCTREDVLWLAGDYRQRAARNLVQAEEFEGLAAQMESAGVVTVGELLGVGVPA